MRERISYLKGLLEGLSFEGETKEQMLLSEIVNVLDDLVTDFELMEDDVDELFEYVEAIDEDLYDVEDFLAEVDDYDFYDDLEFEDYDDVVFEDEDDLEVLEESEEE